MSDDFARAILGDGDADAGSVLAVTVVVTRPVEDADGAYEVLLSERGRGAFARGLWVFPGGRVDAEDAYSTYVEEVSTNWIADRFGLTINKAASLMCGAMRELAEEAAIAAPGPCARTLDEEAWQAVRGGAYVFEPPSGRVWALSRWLPPPIEKRRFDTFFLVCEVPSGTVARADGDELRAHRWLSPEAALEEFRAGSLPLVPPTFRTLMEIGAHRTLRELRGALADHWPPINSPVVRAATAEEGFGIVTEFPHGTRAGLDRGHGHPFHFDGKRWAPLEIA